MRELKSALYLALSLGMLIYAMPRLEMGQGLTLATLFGVAWISMALLVIAAHLRAVLRVDETEETVESRGKWLADRGPFPAN